MDGTGRIRSERSLRTKRRVNVRYMDFTGTLFGGWLFSPRAGLERKKPAFQEMQKPASDLAQAQDSEQQLFYLAFMELEYSAKTSGNRLSASLRISGETELRYGSVSLILFPCFGRRASVASSRGCS